MSDNAERLAVFEAYDQDTLDLYAHALGYKLALWHVREHLHDIIRHCDMSEETRTRLDVLEMSFNEIAQDYHLPQE